MSNNYHSLNDNIINFEGSPIIEREDKIVKKSFLQNNIWIILYMAMAGSVYFCSELIQTSSLIKSNDHNTTTSYSIAYNLLYSLLVVFFLINISNITNKRLSCTRSFLYFIFCHLGAIGFALLGEVSFLRNVVIIPGFWSHLSNGAKITFIAFGLIIILLGLRQAMRALRDNDLCNHFVPYLLVLGTYSVVLFNLITTKANNINIHVHHAIFSGLLSLWFTDWRNCLAMIAHSIFIGVVIEGINFYGIQELSLFLINNGEKVTFNESIIIWGFYLIFLFFSYVVYRQFKR